MNLMTHGQQIFKIFRLCTYFSLSPTLCDFTSICCRVFCKTVL